MKYKKYIFTFFLTILLLQQIVLAGKDTETDAGELESLTLVVGNTRKAGQTSPSVARVVRPDQADFTHTSSFSGRVISVDVGAVQSGQRFSHIQKDWFQVGLADLSQQPTRIFFEWLPSCIMGVRGQNLLPLLSRALQHAHRLLAPNGELVIDHFPYTLSLPGPADTAVRTLLGIEPDAAFVREQVLQHLPAVQDRYDGVVSQLLQQADPFTLSTSGRERVDLKQYFTILLMEERDYQDADTRYMDKQTDIAAAARALAKVEKMFRTTRIQLLELMSEKIVEETDTNSALNMFEWCYFMESRGAGMIKALRQMGFQVDDDVIQYYQKNPYNGRKHAWIIKAKKPATN